MTSVNGIEQKFCVADANIQLANASKEEKKNFAKPEIQSMLQSAKSISLFDAKRDGKLGDNEYLVIQGQDDSYSILYSPKKGTTKVDILCELTKRYNIDKDSIPEKINHNDFIQIPVKKDDTSSEVNAQTAEVLKGLLNGDKKYNFDVQIRKVNGKDMAILKFSEGKASFAQKLFGTTKPSFGYIKEKLGLQDGVLTEYNDIYYCSDRRKPDGTSVMCGSNNFDEWTLEPGRELQIPVSALYKK